MTQDHGRQFSSPNHHSIPIKVATPKSAHPNEYGRYRLITREILAAEPVYPTSPDLAKVTVALGAIVIVWVATIDFPPPLDIADMVGDEDCGEWSAPEEFAVGDEMRYEAELTCTQPFWEHSNLDGQHPPPKALGHSTVESIHLGGFFDDISHGHSEIVELQQNIPEAVKVAL
jgi:hypothetical protein